MIYVLICCLFILLLIAHIIFRVEKFTNGHHDQFFPIHIISLESRKEERLKPLLAKIKTDERYTIRRIYGFDGNKDVIEGFLGKGQIGCWRSHVEHWKDIQHQREPYALVLEDDAVISLPELLPTMYTIVNELPSNWHICYLGGRYADENQTTRVSKHLVQSPSRMWHSHAYLITPEGARQLLQMSREYNTDNRQSTWNDKLPVDDWMTHEERNLNIYKTDPVIVPFADDNIHDTSINHSSNW